MKDDAPVAVQAAIVNEPDLQSFYVGVELIYTSFG
jgi:hypothetical protein